MNVKKDVNIQMMVLGAEDVEIKLNMNKGFYTGLMEKQIMIFEKIAYM